MTQAPYPDSLLPAVPEEDENAIIIEIATEMADEIYSEIDDTYANLIISPAVRPKPREQFERWMLEIVKAYPGGPPELRMTELRLLLNDDYCDLIKAGVMAPPLAKPWSLLIHVPKICRRLQSQLRDLWRQYGDPSVGVG